MAAEGPRAPCRGPSGLLLLILSSVGAGLELSVVSPVTATVGSDALLECTYTVESPPVELEYLGILWLFKESHLLAYGPGMKTFDPRASINQSAIPNGTATLLLSNVTTSDEGLYTCSIIYTPKKDQKTVTLNIQAQPEITVLEQEVVKGKENLLRCSVSGFYPAEIDVLWRRDGKFLPGSSMSKAQRNADGTFTINSTLPFIPTDSDANSNFSCSANHVSLPRFTEKEVPLLFKVVEEKGVNAAAVVVPLLLVLALVAVLGGFLYRKLTHRRLCKIVGPDRWMVGEPVTLSCVGHHWPKDTEIMWLKIQGGETMEIPARCSSEHQQAMQPLLSEKNYIAKFIEVGEGGGSNRTLTASLHITPSLEADEGATFKCIFTPKDIQMKKAEEEFTQFKLYAKPQVTGSIGCIPCSGGKVKCSLELAQFFPEHIVINWSCGTGILQAVPSADHRTSADHQTSADHRTSAVRSECEIPEEYFSDPKFKIRASWKHESLKDAGYTEMSVTDAAYPGRPIAEDIIVSGLVSGVEAFLHCTVSGYFPPNGLEVMWLKLKKGSSAPVPLSGGNDGCVSSVTPEQKEHPYSRIAKLAFTPDFHRDQESEFICQVSHPSLPEALRKLTPKLLIMSVPRTGDLNIVQEGKLQVLTLNVTDFYPETIKISWSCDLPGKEGHLPSKDDEKSKDGTYSTKSRCKLTEVMICRIAQTDINVSIEHESQTEPIRVAMRLDRNDHNWDIVKL